MKLIRIDDIVAEPWKNKAGVTRELARREDANGLIWRMSVADVDRDGPFSVFPGLTRILTVIEGAGLRLHMPDGVIEALPALPVRFDGGVRVDCDLVDGPVRDFNLIFDAARAEIDVLRLEPDKHNVDAALAVLPLGAPCDVKSVGAAPPGSVVLFGANDRNLQINVNAGAVALLVTAGQA
jgi:environmental stress-induced protein Ves